VKIEVFNVFDKQLKSLWDGFEVDANSLAFQSYEWQRYWNEQVGQPEYRMAICIIVCLVDGRVRAIFPFGIKRAMGARVLEFLGGEETDYSAPLLGSDMNSEEFKDIWAKVLRVIPSHDIVFFRNIPEFIHKSENFLLENISTNKVGHSYAASLPDTFDDYSLRLSKNMRKDNQRMIRRLSEMGELSFLVLENSEDFNKVLKVMIAQKEARYTLSGSRNIFFNKSVKNFYTNIHTLLNRGLNVHLSALMLNDEILATHLGIHYQDQFFYLMPAFNHDDKWRKFSLGRIHLEKLISWAIDNKIKNFDFTIGGESYKSIWCDSEMAIYRHFKIRSLRGAIYYTHDFLLELVKSNSFLKSLAVKLLALLNVIKSR